ncbi:MAG: hypothetical protein IJX29_02675 [Bacteroides sp.]|nr:hypothetical protein [Bacteroides sp.]
MKRKITGIAFILLSLMAQAQTGPIFMFEKFTTAKIRFKNRSVTASPMNYDASGGKMYFQQDGNMMEMTHVYMVDTVMWGERKFIPQGKRFWEVFKQKNGTVFVDWLLKDVHLGSKGAFGLPTQGKVETLKLADFSAGAPGGYSYDAQGTYSKDVWKRKNDNTYYFMYEGKMRKIKSEKQLRKLFKPHEPAIKDFADKEKIDMKEVIDALKLIDYCLGL